MSKRDLMQVAAFKSYFKSLVSTLGPLRAFDNAITITSDERLDSFLLRTPNLIDKWSKKRKEIRGLGIWTWEKGTRRYFIGPKNCPLWEIHSTNRPPAVKDDGGYDLFYKGLFVKHGQFLKGLKQDAYNLRCKEEVNYEITN